MNYRDVVVVALSLLDVISGAALALSYGFFMLPSAIGYLVGAIGGFVTGSVTPVSFMYESMVLSWNQSKDLRNRISMILLAALITGLCGVFGLPQKIVDSIGNDIFLGMMAGVGIYLAKVGFDIAYRNRTVGIPCLVAAIIIQLITGDLVSTVALTIPFGVAINLLISRKHKDQLDKINVPVYKSWKAMFTTEMKIIKPVINRQVIIGSLVLTTLTIGGNLAYTAANAQISNTIPTYNQSTVISGLADFASSLFGGANMELIVSPTSATPHPAASGIAFMLLSAVLLATGLVHKIASKVPLSAMGGYLFVIGAMIILPYNISAALAQGDITVVSFTMAITALSNPFYGLVAGLVAKLLIFS